MKRDDLTIEERIIYMPTWEKIAITLFVACLPVIGSLVALHF